MAYKKFQVQNIHDKSLLCIPSYWLMMFRLLLWFLPPRRISDVLYFFLEVPKDLHHPTSPVNTLTVSKTVLKAPALYCTTFHTAVVIQVWRLTVILFLAACFDCLKDFYRWALSFSGRHSVQWWTPLELHLLYFCLTWLSLFPSWGSFDLGNRTFGGWVGRGANSPRAWCACLMMPLLGDQPSLCLGGFEDLLIDNSRWTPLSDCWVCMRLCALQGSVVPCVRLTSTTVPARRASMEPSVSTTPMATSASVPQVSLVSRAPGGR